MQESDTLEIVHRAHTAAGGECAFQDNDKPGQNSATLPLHVRGCTSHLLRPRLNKTVKVLHQNP